MFRLLLIPRLEKEKGNKCWENGIVRNMSYLFICPILYALRTVPLLLFELLFLMFTNCAVLSESSPN